jgi:toxin HigB-1
VTIVTILLRKEVIRRFRHRGLRRFYEHDERRGLGGGLVDKISRVLALLDRAVGPQDMNLPGFRLHPLKGSLAGYWSVTTSANWRVVFRFENGDATDIDLIDYH